MTANTEILLALVSPVPGREEEFRSWYWDTHLPEVVALPGFVSAQRFEAGSDQASHRYATIYAVEGSAAAALGSLFSAGVGMSDALDLGSMIMIPLVPEGSPVLPA